MQDQRTETITLRLTETEKNLIDTYRNQRQLLATQKVSRADAILAAIKFASGKMLLK